MEKNKVVVILSGGSDSVTLLYWANQRYDVEALTFDYGSKHNKREQVFAKYHCEKLKIPHKIVDLDLDKMGFKSSLLKRMIKAFPSSKV